MKKKILTFLLALFFIHTTAVQAYAVHPVPDLSKNGSITFEMVKNNTPLNGGNITLCKVGDIQENDGNYSFVLIEALKDYNVDLSTPTDYDVAETLLQLAKTHQLPTLAAPIVNGKAVFTQIPVGLYLIWQDEKDATEGFSPIHPFLISIPKLEGEQYIQDIVAKPKVPLVTKPTETPTPPPSPPPKLPQTGQLNWPIPVMAVAGCVLFSIGLILYGGRKRTDNSEK
jgi:LPXTG-motif cell wall-anchored protein